jgi:hypothetical protein
MAGLRAKGFGDHTTNYRDAFIEASQDGIRISKTPEKPDSVAALQYRMVAGRPYQMTSDDLLFGVFAERNAIAAGDRPAARDAFFSRSQACLRASPLVKLHGWGIHHDAEGRIALIGQDDPRYAALMTDPTVTVIGNMRRARKPAARPE